MIEVSHRTEIGVGVGPLILCASTDGQAGDKHSFSVACDKHLK